MSGVSCMSWPRLALVLLVLVSHGFSLHVMISPKRGHLNKDGDNLTVTCQADQAITRCQFNFIKDGSKEGPFIDLSMGSRSAIDTSLLGSEILAYRYVGTGLDQGQCGIRLHLASWKRDMLSCRVKADTGGWKYGIMSYTADGSSSIPVTVNPMDVLALPGTDQNINILCKAQHSLSWCRMDLPGPGKGHLFLDQGPESKDSTPEHRYYGAGLDKGECGISLTPVTEEWNGFAFCGMITTPGTWERTGIPVVVARAPGKPVLEINSEMLYDGGTLEATCTVSGGRPLPNVTWYLDNLVLRSDEEDDVPDELWRWPTSLQRITQKLRVRLSSRDNGRVLKCEATHVALNKPLVATRTLRFTFTNACPPLTSDSVRTTCHLAGEELNCSLPQEIGTTAELRCKPGYAYPPGVPYRSTTCLRGGKWNRDMFTCDPDCGRRKTNSGATLVAGGSESKIGEFPWHVAIYEQKDSGRIQHICGGTIISKNAIISAAHCFSLSGVNVAGNAARFKVAAGQQLRGWDDPDPSVQKRDVLDVLLHKRFRGRDTNFIADIAILRLTVSFHITTRVNLICVDWDNDFESRQLTSGVNGVAAGWGFTENGLQSDSLMYVNLPFIPEDVCLDALPRASLQLLTADKFCAGHANKSTSVCRGDSGGGLVFRNTNNDKYNLRGIVSIAFPQEGQKKICYSELYTGFTKLSLYISWIQENI